MSLICPRCSSPLKQIGNVALCSNDFCDYVIQATPAFTCPRCQAVSHHPMDLDHGYCGRCHAFTGPTRFEQLSELMRQHDPLPQDNDEIVVMDKDGNIIRTDE